MRVLETSLVTVVMVLAAVSVGHAFQETQTGKVQPPSTVVDAAKKPEAITKGKPGGATFTTGTRSAEISTEGVEVKVPGLGKLGVLPRLDFGLELLYGSDQRLDNVPGVPGKPDSGDVTIKGTIKRRF